MENAVSSAVAGSRELLSIRKRCSRLAWPCLLVVLFATLFTSHYDQSVTGEWLRSVPRGTLGRLLPIGRSVHTRDYLIKSWILRMSPEGRVTEDNDATEQSSGWDAIFTIRYTGKVSYRGFFMALERESRHRLEITLGAWPSGTWSIEPWTIRKKLYDWLKARQPDVFCNSSRIIDEYRPKWCMDDLGKCEEVRFRQPHWIGYGANALTLGCLAIVVIGIKQKLSQRRDKRSIRAME